MGSKAQNMYHYPLIRFLALLIIAAAIPTQVCSQEVEVPVATQYQIFAKALSFDRRLRNDGDKVLTFAVLYQSDVKSSNIVHDEMLETINNSKIKTIQGLPLKCISIDFTIERNLKEALRERDVDVLYITPMRAFDLHSLLTICKDNSILTLSGAVEYIRRGVALGIRTKRNRPEININLEEARAEGADFSSRLLKLSRIIY